MAVNWLQRLNQNLGQEGLGNALGLLGMGLMRGGARSTDPGAVGKGLAQGFGGFSGAMQDARNTAFQRKYQTAQLANMQAQAAEASRLVKARGQAMGMLGYDESTEAFKTPQDYAGYAAPHMDQSRLPMGPQGMEIPGGAQMPERRAQDDPFKGFSPQETRMIQTVALMDPTKAVEKYFEIKKTKSSLKGHKTIKGADGFNYWATGPKAGQRVLPGVKNDQLKGHKTIKGEDGYNYWVTGPKAGQRVMPGLEKPPPNTKRVLNTSTNELDWASDQQIADNPNLKPPPTGMEFTSDGQGGFTLTTGGAGELANKTISNVEKRIISGTEGLARVNNIMKGYEDAFQTLPVKWEVLKGQWLAKLAGTGAIPAATQKIMVKVAKHRRDTAENLNQHIHDRTGAQVAKHEVGRLMAEVPVAGSGLFDGDDPITFRAKAEGLQDSLRKAVFRQHYYLKRGITNVEEMAKITALDDIEILIDPETDEYAVRIHGEVIAESDLGEGGAI